MSIGLIGKLVRVTNAITPENPGTVNIFIRGGTEQFFAQADEKIERGAEVVITNHYPPRTVAVKLLTLEES